MQHPVLIWLPGLRLDIRPGARADGLCPPRTAPGGGPLAAAAAARCLFSAAAPRCVRAGGSRQPPPPAPLDRNGRQQRAAWHGDAQPPQQGRPPRQPGRCTLSPRPGSGSGPRATPAGRYRQQRCSHGEPHHPDPGVFRPTGLPALRPAARRLYGDAGALATARLTLCSLISQTDP
jgi:hypothetical protein